MISSETAKYQAKIYFSVFFVLGFTILLYFESVKTLSELWLGFTNPTYSHGVALLLITLYVFFSRLNKLSGQLLFVGSLPAAIALLIMSFLWGGMVLAGIRVGHQLLFIIVLSATFWVLFGYRAIDKLSMPILFLVFAIPIWDILNQGGLQIMTAHLVSVMIKFSGILVYQDGIDIFLAAGQFRVAENCSGMRQLVVSIPIAVLFSSINGLSVKNTVIVVVLFMVSSVISNIIRIYVVVMSGYFTDMQHYFVTEDHVGIGWAIFLIIIFTLMYFLSKFIARFRLQTKSEPQNTQDKSALNSRHPAFVLGLAVLSILPGPIYSAYHLNKSVSGVVNEARYETIEGWRRADAGDGYRPILTAADIAFHANYEQNDKTLSFFMNYYSMQAQGHEAVSSENLVYDDNEWMLITKSNFQTILSGDLNLVVNEFTLRNSANKEKLVWQWYYLNGKHTHNALTAKLYGILGAFSNRTGAAIFVTAIDLDGPQIAERQRLNDFLTALLPDILDNINEY